MFVNRLTQEQKQAVFDLAVNLANADNNLSVEEINYLKEFSDKHDIKYDLDKSNINVDDTLVVFNKAYCKIILLQELIKLSYRDGHFGKEEQEKVFMIAQKTGMNDPELILRIEKWVREGVNWSYEGEQMLDYLLARSS